MPHYDFTCLRCDVTVEKYFSFEENQRPTCDICGEFLNKVFNSTPTHFKGGGWGGK